MLKKIKIILFIIFEYMILFRKNKHSIESFKNI